MIRVACLLGGSRMILDRKLNSNWLALVTGLLLILWRELTETEWILWLFVGVGVNFYSWMNQVIVSERWIIYDCFLKGMAFYWVLDWFDRLSDFFYFFLILILFFLFLCGFEEMGRAVYIHINLIANSHSVSLQFISDIREHHTLKHNFIIKRK